MRMAGDIMAQLIKGVVDTQKNSYRSIGQVSAGDDLELELTIQMNGQPIQFVDPQAELLIKKSDNNKVRQTKDILYQDGKFKIKLDKQGVTCTGIVVNQLTINDGGRISTCLFYFMVNTSLDGEILKSISKVEVLEQLEEYIVTAFANLKDFEEKVLSSDETIRKLNYDMNESEKIRDTAELQRQETFKSLKENMNEAITNLESSINLSNMNEKERSEVFNSLKSNLESIKQDLINLNASVESEEEKRVQAEINRVNKALEIIEKLESTNNSVATAEAERVSEFNKIKTENNTLKEALTTINNTANSNEEVRKENETSRVEAEKARVNEFNTMKLENETFKQEINEQYETIITKNTEFKEQMNTDFGNAKTDYFGEEHLNVVDRLNSDFDNVHQRINDSSYLEYSGTNITADNSYYGLTKELSIKGRTLQNICPSSFTVNFENDTFGLWMSKFLYLKGFGDVFREETTLEIKPSTTYTIICKVVENTLTSKMALNNFDASSSIIKEHLFINPNETGILKFICNSISDFSILNQTINPVVIRCQNSGAVGKVIINNIMLLEGDYTNTPIEELSFGEGIYSVGENEENLIKVKIFNKNLFTAQLPNIKSNGVTLEIRDGKYVVSSSTISPGYPCVSYKLPIKYLLGKKVRFSCNVEYSGDIKPAFICSYKRIDGSYNYITVSNSSVVQTFPNICESTELTMNLTVNNKGDTGVVGSATFSQVMVQIDNTDTSYIDGKLIQQELQLTEPLRSIPNGMIDEVLEDGTEVRRTKKVVFDGSEDWVVQSLNYNDNGLLNARINTDLKGTDKILCDRFIQQNTGIGATTTEGIMISSDYKLYIRIKQETANTIEGFKEWLSQNNVTCIMPLQEEVITKHNKNINLKTFEGTTHITSDNYLQPTISCKVPSNVQAVVSSLMLENEELNNTISLMSVENEENNLTNIETNLNQEVRITMLEMGVL